MRYVVLRTHGGLGNQIFQVLYGRMFAEQAGLMLREVHDLNYVHAFPRTKVLAWSPKPDHLQRLFSVIRLPKILKRLTGRIEGAVRIGGTIYLDSYFQSAQAYKCFPRAMVARHLARLANELRIGPADIDCELVHLRLGDFFVDREHARRHAIERLARVKVGSYVITNDESLLQENSVLTLMTHRALTLVSTESLPAEDVLRTMARYKTIDANDSTLTFWVSVLGGAHVTLCNPSLQDCREFLLSCLEGRVT